MKKITGRMFLMAVIAIYTVFNSNGQSSDAFVVKVDKPGVSIQPEMWGLFFEDINFGADGGMYAELVKNRSFEFFKPMMGWTIKGKKFSEGDMLVINRKQENTANPRFLRVRVNDAGRGELGLINEGFRGMGIKKDLRYNFSIMYQQSQPGVKIHVGFLDSTGKELGGTVVVPPAAGEAWQKATASFTATATVLKAKMYLWFEGNGTIDIDMVSLFPSDTWKNRPGGMRADMIQMLADMNPGFLRFPGGCIVEGPDLSLRYQWKKTIGPIEERPLMVNRWNFEFPYRPAPDYFQTFGLGFFEYFQLSEDIGASPLPILNCGMACQYNSAEVVPLDDLGPYIQDALDLVEFANGDLQTKWGKIRADLGHPAPFNLKMMGIGNENWGPQYIERLQLFTKAIKAKYPGIRIVNSSGTDPDGKRFEYLDTSLRNANADIIDEHYYRSPEWFLSNARRYDKYPRNGTKIFGGEYAAQGDKSVSIDHKSIWKTAIAEAAFMTGLERNADVVSMASYAPLFAHVEGWQWSPDLIWVNNLQSFGTPNYYVQKLYSLNKGSKVVPITLNNDVIAGQDSLYGSAAMDESTNELIIKIVNASAKQDTRTIELQGVKNLSSTGKLIVLRCDDPANVNTTNEPVKVVPSESTLAVKGKKINFPIPPCSFSVLRIKIN